MYLWIHRPLIFSLLLAVSALALAEALPLPTFMTNREAGFRISYPLGWSTAIYPDPDANRIDIADANAFLQVDAIPLAFLRTLDPEELVALFLEELAYNFDEVELEVLVGESLAELDAIRIAYRAVVGADTIVGALTFTLAETFLYLIDFYVSEAFFDEYEATMLAMVASFRFIED
jgi:hypothetical protein